MYITVCNRCGEVKVISSISGKNGVTRAYWSCPSCGAGQLVEIVSSRTVCCGSLRDIVTGLGVVSDKTGCYQKEAKRKSFPSICD